MQSRRSLSLGWTAVAIIMVVAASCAASTPTAASSTFSSTIPAAPTTITTGTAATTSTTSLPAAPPFAEPSQTPADAQRDGVVPAVAALTLHDRVRTFIEQVTDEGRWVLSELPIQPDGNCVRGDQSGTFGRDWICDGEYREILLLDHAGTTILRAFPFPGLPPYEMIVTPDAVYCGRQGDGGLPNSMLCRIDRSTLTIAVRVYPWGGGPDPVYGTAVFPTWVLDEPITEDIIFRDLSFIDGMLTTDSGRTSWDPQTLKRL